MKRIICTLLCIILLSSSVAWAESYTELVEVYALAGRRMWAAVDWETVVIPWGIWEIGVDIPAGRWKLEAATDTSSEIAYGPILSEGGAELPLSTAYAEEQLVSVNSPAYDKWDASEIELELKKGSYLQVKYGAVRLTPLEKKSAYLFPAEKSAAYEGMSYVELVKERESLKEAAKTMNGWCEIELGSGRYTVGESENIRWNIEAVGDDKALVAVNYQGKELLWASPRNQKSAKCDSATENDVVSITLPVGAIIEVKRGEIVMTPYLGQKELTFE